MRVSDCYSVFDKRGKMIVDGHTGVIGIIGNPVRHTKSPAIHNYISNQLDKNLVYVPFEVTGDVITAVKGAYELGILGMNVTVPYKTDVISTLCDIDSLAKRIGAVNTLVRTDKGYKGYNTDMLGLERAVFSEGIELKGKTAVLLGAGGASRAAAFMCAKNNVSKLYILNRTVSKAEEIAKDIEEYIREASMDTTVVTLPMNAYSEIAENNLIVFQCTKIGLNEDDGAVIEDKSFYSKIEAGVDLIYRDGTEFVKLIKENGGRAFNGMKMLIYQGVIAYELWNEMKVPEDVVQGVERLLENG